MSSPGEVVVAKPSEWVPSASPWLIAASVMAAMFMVVLDSSVANVALPHIAGNLSASNDEATWVLTSYLVSNAIMLPAASWITRRIGRKRLLMLSIAAFTGASLLCGMAVSMPMLILARILQGIGGGGMQPLAQSIQSQSCFAASGSNPAKTQPEAPFTPNSRSPDVIDAPSGAQLERSSSQVRSHQKSWTTQLTT